MSNCGQLKSKEFAKKTPRLINSSITKKEERRNPFTHSFKKRFRGVNLNWIGSIFGTTKIANTMETYYGIDDNGDLQDLWDNDFGVVSNNNFHLPARSLLRVGQVQCYLGLAASHTIIIIVWSRSRAESWVQLLGRPILFLIESEENVEERW